MDDDATAAVDGRGDPDGLTDRGLGGALGVGRGGGGFAAGGGGAGMTSNVASLVSATGGCPDVVVENQIAISNSRWTASVALIPATRALMV